MSKYYELVIFTAALQEYADKVIDEIDKKKNVKYRLYRQHTKKEEKVRIKVKIHLGSFSIGKRTQQSHNY